MERRYCNLRIQLDELGYKQQLSLESVPLVERLLGDLIKTTENLQEYKNLAQAAIEDRDNLELGAEPFKCDNAKLVQECNDVHMAFMHFKEQTEKLHRDLKQRINTLEREKEKLLENQKKLKEISKAPFRRTVTSKTSLGTTSTKSLPKIDKKKEKTEEIENMMSLADKRIANLAKEVKKLKADHNQHLELIDSLQFKLNNRDREIARLSALLEGGRPLPALSKDCCYKNMSNKISDLADELESLKIKNQELDMQLADSVARQHEAMKRALQLADRNKLLEKELKDIDKIALVVEQDCDNKVRTKAEQMEYMRSRMEELHKKLEIAEERVDDLERLLNEAHRRAKEQDADIELLKSEKEKLKHATENALYDKKRLTDRINQLSRIENDLNREIDRLVEVSTLQKRKISELEYATVTGQLDKQKEDLTPDERGDMNKRSYQIEGDIRSNGRRPAATKGPCDECDDDDVADQIRKLREQKEFYYNEWKTLRNQKTCMKDKSDDMACLKRMLEERESKIEGLQQEIREMMREKQNLISRMEQLQEIKELSQNIEADGMSIKAALGRAEKERDLARADVRRLEIERDALRERMQITAETNVVERTKLERIVQETEEKLRQLEAERRELVTVQGARRASINRLESEVEQLTKKLGNSQQELGRMNTLYAQVRALHEQTDRALSDTQAQNSQLEMEYATAQDRIVQLERERAESDAELGVLRNDLAVIKTKLANLDQDKDQLIMELDGKTEQLSLMENELKTKGARLAQLETQYAELKKQMTLEKANINERERAIHDMESELCTVKRDLERESTARCAATTELRRAQDELANARTELRCARTELEQRCREAEDLRRQLQEYVHEVRRAEDLLGEKERERKQLLEQFCNLSHEATQLESTNHSLEKGACEARAQLGDALEESCELKHKLENAQTLCCEYEAQIDRLTQRIAQLECQQVCSNRVEQLEQLLEQARRKSMEARMKENERECELQRLRCIVERLAGGGNVPLHDSMSQGAGEILPVTGLASGEVKPPVPARRDPSVRLSTTRGTNDGSNATAFSHPELSVYTANYSISTPDTSGDRKRVHRSPSPPKSATTPEITPRSREQRNTF